MKPNQATLEFIHSHSGEDAMTLSLRFAGKQVGDVDIPFAVKQIEARNKAASKLPWLADTPDFLFPDALSAEQCTAQRVADYHRLVAGAPRSVLDLTCGLGIDVMTIASGAGRVFACDISPAHVECARHNAGVLGLHTFRVECTDAAGLLKSLDPDERFDLVFVDPARRNNSGARTYALADCSPDIMELMPLIRRHTDRLMVKVSPMLDVKMVLSQLPAVSHVHAVSLRGECKELLLDCDFRAESQVVVFSAVNIAADGEPSVFTFAEGEGGTKVALAEESDLHAGSWLFEPDASLMKFLHVAPLGERFSGLRKLAPNTHVFVGEGEPPAGLPGRVLRIVDSWPSYKHCAGNLPAQLNIVTRNFPDTPVQVKKRLKVKDGGNDFLYCCRVGDKRMRLILCR